MILLRRGLHCHRGPPERLHPRWVPTGVAQAVGGGHGAGEGLLSVPRPVPQQPPGSPAPCQAHTAREHPGFLLGSACDGWTDGQPCTHSCCALRAAPWARPEPGGERPQPRSRWVLPELSVPVTAPALLGSDLALRNCLLTADLTVKIGDYGLSHCKYKVRLVGGRRGLCWDPMVPPCAPTECTDPTEPSPHPQTLTHPSPAVSGHPCISWGAGGVQTTLSASWCGPLSMKEASPRPKSPSTTQRGGTAWAGPDVPLCQAQAPAGPCQHSLGWLICLSGLLQFAQSSCRAGIAKLGVWRGAEGGRRGGNKVPGAE